MLSIKPGPALALVVLVGLAWAWDHEAGERRVAELRADTLARAADRLRDLVQAQGQAIAAQDTLQQVVEQITTATRETEQTLRLQGVELSRTIEQMRRTNEAVDAYLRAGVPADIGVRYARPDTADPVAYRAASAVRTGGVPAAGSPAAAGQ